MTINPHISFQNNSSDVTKMLVEAEDFKKFINPEELEDRTAVALDYIMSYSGIDGAHHKSWVIDQVIRALTGDKYDAWVKEAKGDFDVEEDEYDYTWDEGIAP